MVSEQTRDFRMHDPLWRSLYMNVLMFFHDKIAWIKIHFCGYNEIKRFGWRRIVICVRAAICYLGEWMCFSWLFESEHFMEYYKNWCLLGWLVGRACFAIRNSIIRVCIKSSLMCDLYAWHFFSSFCSAYQKLLISLLFVVHAFFVYSSFHLVLLWYISALLFFLFFFFSMFDVKVQFVSFIEYFY